VVTEGQAGFGNATEPLVEELGCELPIGMHATVKCELMQTVANAGLGSLSRSQPEKALRRPRKGRDDSKPD
jgi:hypothetical protein